MTIPMNAREYTLVIDGTDDENVALIQSEVIAAIFEMVDMSRQYGAGIHVQLDTKEVRS